MSTFSLTPTQARVQGFIERYMALHGQSPTLPEIGKGVGIHSRGTVHRHVQALVKQHWLEQSKRKWRGLRLPAEDTDSSSSLPLLGRIAAGRPIEAIVGQERVNLDVLVGPNRYVLRVKGDSMKDAGILDGDMVVVERRETARIGEIVVALIDNFEATLKRFRPRPDKRIELVPANPDMAPMIYAAERVQIQGVVVGQLRLYS